MQHACYRSQMSPYLSAVYWEYTVVTSCCDSWFSFSELYLSRGRNQISRVFRRKDEDIIVIPREKNFIRQSKVKRVLYRKFKSKRKVDRQWSQWVRWWSICVVYGWQYFGKDGRSCFIVPIRKDMLYACYCCVQNLPGKRESWYKGVIAS